VEEGLAVKILIVKRREQTLFASSISIPT